MEKNKNTILTHADARMKEITVMGVTYLTTFTKKYLNRKKWEKPDFKKVISFIPGTIREIYVKPGDQVLMNDKLVIMEAMKMLNTIIAPITGKIKSVAVNTGDKLPKGALIVEFE